MITKTSMKKVRVNFLLSIVFLVDFYVTSQLSESEFLCLPNVFQAMSVF